MAVSCQAVTIADVGDGRSAPVCSRTSESGKPCLRSVLADADVHKERLIAFA